MGPQQSIASDKDRKSIAHEREREGGRESGVMEAEVDIVWHYRRTFRGGTLRYWFRQRATRLAALFFIARSLSSPRAPAPRRAIHPHEHSSSGVQGARAQAHAISLDLGLHIGSLMIYCRGSFLRNVCEFLPRSRTVIVSYHAPIY